MRDNLFLPLIDSAWNFGKFIYQQFQSLPSYIELVPTNTICCGNSLSIPIGETKSNELYLNINQSNPHTYLVGNTRIREI
ncbi:hypothetical protein [Romboutsia ilealis]|uniref:hypothetical protein n=1 Tax=Romboutsia ilealis TaxID=1115758 RepID=UPI00267722F9|nr:hypothetical protein [Romboutsia ilealis]